MIGVSLSPILILGYLVVLGTANGSDDDDNDDDNTDYSIGKFTKFALRVVVPVVFGQVLKTTSKFAREVVTRHQKYFKRAERYIPIYVVYTVFCRIFSREKRLNVSNILIMILFQFIHLCSLMAFAWFALRIFFPNEPELNVMGLFGCTFKTVVIGIPLIDAIYEHHPLFGLYTLPLLVWHPMQLLIGSFLAPRLLSFVERENKQSGRTKIENDDVELEIALATNNKKEEKDDDVELETTTKSIDS